MMNFFPENALPEDDLRKDLMMDGIDIAMPAMEIEDAHHIAITDAQINAWRTVADVIAVIPEVVE